MSRVIVEISVKREKMQTVFLQLSSLLRIATQLWRFIATNDRDLCAEIYLETTAARISLPFLF